MIIVKQKGSYEDMLNAARTTVGKADIEKTKNKELVARLIRSEHSPIRLVSFEITLDGIPYWVSVHLVRHKVGVEHFVSTQRTDRKGEDRNSKRQDELVRHRIVANIQALINISRKRLCYQASRETRELWEEVVKQLPNEVGVSCVKECVYRGFCPEMSPCKYTESWQYREERKDYLSFNV